LLTPEPFSEHAEAFTGNQPGPLIVSDLAGVEFASAIARRVRMRLFTADQAQSALSLFDHWVAQLAIRTEITSADTALAGSFLRRLDLPLRTLDALHIAITQRLGATLVTFDRRMADSARALSVAVAVP
jgi:predicted nucleic acid-binding protein